MKCDGTIQRCEPHGYIGRACPQCEDEQEIATLRERVASLETAVACERGLRERREALLEAARDLIQHAEHCDPVLTRRGTVNICPCGALEILGEIAKALAK